MGGTSTDISFVTSSEIGQSDGTVGRRPCVFRCCQSIPSVPVGSIARRDEAGVLVVNRSAGAYPDLPTVVVTNTFQRLRTLTFALSIRFWGAISS